MKWQLKMAQLVLAVEAAVERQGRLAVLAAARLVVERQDWLPRLVVQQEV